MTTVTFDGLTLNEPKVDRQPVPLISADRLVSGKTKVTTSTEISYTYTVTCLAYSSSELSTIIAKFGTKGSLVIDGATVSNCAIKSYSEIELNPNTWQVKLGFVVETT